MSPDEQRDACERFLQLAEHYAEQNYPGFWETMKKAGIEPSLDTFIEGDYKEWIEKQWENYMQAMDNNSLT